MGLTDNRRITPAMQPTPPLAPASLPALHFFAQPYRLQAQASQGPWARVRISAGRVLAQGGLHPLTVPLPAGFAVARAITTSA